MWGYRKIFNQSAVGLFRSNGTSFLIVIFVCRSTASVLLVAMRGWCIQLAKQDQQMKDKPSFTHALTAGMFTAVYC